MLQILTRFNTKEPHQNHLNLACDFLKMQNDSLQIRFKHYLGKKYTAMNFIHTILEAKHVRKKTYYIKIYRYIFGCIN